MEKLITLITLKLLMKDESKVVKVFESIYSVDSKYKPSNSSVGHVKKSNNKKEELLESLNYLKSKKKKSVKDRESIGILESVLSNLK